jgi:hypothetical protein
MRKITFDPPTIFLSRIFSMGISILFVPPVYPTLICLARLCFGNEYANHAVIVFQYLLFYVSIIFFHRIVQNDHLSLFCSSACTLCYALSPTILSWNQTIGTESVAISSFVIIISTFLTYLHCPTHKKAAFLGISGFYLVMLRPAFIFFAPLMLVFWLPVVLSRKANFYQHLTGFAWTCISICLLLGFSHLVHKKCGVFSVSEVLVVNQYQIMIQSGLYQKAKDREAVDIIQKIIDNDQRQRPYLEPGNPWIYPHPQGLCDLTCRQHLFGLRPKHLSLERRSALVAQILRDHPWEYFRYSMGKFIGVRHEMVGGQLSPKIVKFQLIYFLLASEAVSILHYRFRTADSILFRSMIWLVISGVIVTTVLGTPHLDEPGVPSHYSRLIMPAFPFVILYAFRYFNIIVLYWNKIGQTPEIITSKQDVMS